MRPNASMTIVRETPGGWDEYGNPIESEEETIGTFDGLFAPRAARSQGTVEQADVDRDALVLRPVAYFQTQIPVQRDDHIVLESGDRFRVVGRPDVWREPGMTVRGMEVQLEHTEG